MPQLRQCSVLAAVSDESLKAQLFFNHRPKWDLKPADIDRALNHPRVHIDQSRCPNPDRGQNTLSVCLRKEHINPFLQRSDGGGRRIVCNRRLIALDDMAIKVGQHDQPLAIVHQRAKRSDRVWSELEKDWRTSTGRVAEADLDGDTGLDQI